jgi:ATP-dependent Clp protease ATP-binding subunit ClpA
VELSGTAESGSSLPIVDTADIERIVEAWTRIPVETMGQEEKGKLGELVRTWLQE